MKRRVAQPESLKGLTAAPVSLWYQAAVNSDWIELFRGTASGAAADQSWRQADGFKGRFMILPLGDRPPKEAPRRPRLLWPPAPDASGVK
jgi:hypothetical protein